MAERTCSVADCGRRRERRDWCDTHYRRWLKHGSADPGRPLAMKQYPIRGDLRLCGGCDRWLHLSQYTERRSRCRDCRAAYARLWREANPDYWREWGRANPDKVSAAVHRRRALLKGCASEHIDRSVVFERDGFCCLLCGDPLDMDAAPFTPLAPTIDHVVPLARGGDHLYANVQAAHFRCNVVKGARV